MNSYEFLPIPCNSLQFLLVPINSQRFILSHSNSESFLALRSGVENHDGTPGARALVEGGGVRELKWSSGSLLETTCLRNARSAVLPTSLRPASPTKGGKGVTYILGFY